MIFDSVNWPDYQNNKLFLVIISLYFISLQGGRGKSFKKVFLVSGSKWKYEMVIVGRPWIQLYIDKPNFPLFFCIFKNVWKALA